VPNWLILVVSTVGTCALVLLIVVLRRRRAANDDPTQTPDVIEYITMMIGVVYAIVLGLAMAGVWEERGAAEDWVRSEAQALHEVSTRAQAYPEEIRDRIQAQVDGYVTHVLEVEWPHLVEHAELTEEGDALLAELRRTIALHEPVEPLEAYGYHGLMDRAAAVGEARTARAQAAEPTMPGLVWFGLVSGGVVAIGMLFALQIQRSARELVLAGLFSALIAFLLFLIWHFDSPFARGLGDPTEPFEILFPALAGED
jgi:protein-S-isoprenylcysteine O-methyltransferase Ste14